MTAPLFTDRDPCGCERALGHVCCPPWMDENEWPGQAARPAKLQGCDAKMETTDLNRSAPNRELGHYPAGASINATEERDRMSDHTPVPTSVYRYYDKAGVLLYVGITSRAITRQREHNADKEWWRFVHRQEVEHYPSRPHAMSREAGLIRKYRPPFNVQHNPAHAETRAAYLSLATDKHGVREDLQGMIYRDRGKLAIEMNVLTDGALLVMRSNPADAHKLIGLDDTGHALDDANVSVVGDKGAGVKPRYYAVKSGRLIIYAAYRRSIKHHRSAIARLRMPNGAIRAVTVKSITIGAFTSSPALGGAK